MSDPRPPPQETLLTSFRFRSHRWWYQRWRGGSRDSGVPEPGGQRQPCPLSPSAARAGVRGTAPARRRERRSDHRHWKQSRGQKPRSTPQCELVCADGDRAAPRGCSESLRDGDIEPQYERIQRQNILGYGERSHSLGGMALYLSIPLCLCLPLFLRVRLSLGFCLLRSLRSSPFSPLSNTTCVASIALR